MEYVCVIPKNICVGTYGVVTALVILGWRQ